MDCQNMLRISFSVGARSPGRGGLWYWLQSNICGTCQIARVPSDPAFILTACVNTLPMSPGIG
jgi:hypothetical protein